MRYLVIGGTSGIGAALVQNLSQQGHEIMVAARNQPSLSHLPVPLVLVLQPGTVPNPLTLLWQRR